MYPKNHTCCFTGHRFIPPEQISPLASALEHAVTAQLDQGIFHFCVGGALGFDTLAAETLLHLRDRRSELRLTLVLPCRDQARRWTSEAAERYQAILSQANTVIYTGEHYSAGCMHRRNRFLVDHSAICIAYCTQNTGGTAYTVQYARQKNLPIIFLAP